MLKFVLILFFIYNKFIELHIKCRFWVFVLIFLISYCHNKYRYRNNMFNIGMLILFFKWFYIYRNRISICNNLKFRHNCILVNNFQYQYFRTLISYILLFRMQNSQFNWQFIGLYCLFGNLISIHSLLIYINNSIRRNLHL